MGDKPIWEKPAPKGTRHTHLPAEAKSAAKKHAEAAGRPWPNAVDSIREASREKRLANGGKAYHTPAWSRSEGKDKTGGLNSKGRASYSHETGGHLKPPVSAKQAAKSPEAAARRKSFCARMGGNPGLMKDEHGKPTRKALALKKWDCRE